MKTSLPDFAELKQFIEALEKCPENLREQVFDFYKDLYYSGTTKFEINHFAQKSKVEKWMSERTEEMSEANPNISKTTLGKIILYVLRNIFTFENPTLSEVRKERLLTQERKSKKKWVSIAQEVFLRKSLIFAAKKDLESNGIDDALQKATTDVFVEKAQKQLTSKGKTMFWIAAVCIIFTISALGYFVSVLLPLITAPEPKEFDSYNFVLQIISKITIGSTVGGGAYILFSLAKAFLHEGQIAFNKRHALRFGRLYVYLKKGTVNFKELEEAFKWNTEFNTAFKDINSEIITRTIFKSIVDIIPKLAETIVSSAKETKDKKEK